MEKPEGYDECVAFGEFETLPAGGHKCIIKQVKSEKTQNGKEYLKLAIDIAEGEYKDFYQKKFDNDTREEKKWSGVWTVFTKGYNPGTTNPKFKGLITSVEASNTGFKFDWGKDENEKDLVGKKVGIIFREEEFEGTYGDIKSATKPFLAVSYDKAEEAKIPNPKKLAEKGEAFETASMASDNDDRTTFLMKGDIFNGLFTWNRMDRWFSKERNIKGKEMFKFKKNANSKRNRNGNRGFKIDK